MELASKQFLKNEIRQADKTDRKTDRQACDWSLATLTPGKQFATTHIVKGGREGGQATREKLDKVKALFHMKSRV